MTNVGTMKLLGPDGSGIMEVDSISVEKGNIVIRGKIMGAMPLSAVVQPQQLRNGIKLLSVRVVLRAIGMLITGK
ncbi:UNVERIFIED_ORG: hypothetical protein ABID33_002242 [Xanthobacter viscosus]|uniref:Uncharacterized protein n=1 Tax=Xanthobacter autotrophicus TaxID=280 RepID=A0A6C1KAP0_XANAU|nr:hypothetical protein [Xanthobacter autotrophicus]TLX41379.1 hypothetical protein FBQ73_18060 [Xanthobacter autotrophicus]